MMQIRYPFIRVFSLCFLPDSVPGTVMLNCYLTRVSNDTLHYYFCICIILGCNAVPIFYYLCCCLSVNVWTDLTSLSIKMSQQRLQSLLSGKRWNYNVFGLQFTREAHTYTCIHKYTLHSDTLLVSCILHAQTLRQQ